MSPTPPLSHLHVPGLGRASLWATLVFMALGLVGCETSAVLRDEDSLPVGSRIEFWVYHDDLEWVESNIHIAYLPRPMTGAEVRLWAEGVGQRDADMRWTHYRVLGYLPEKPHYVFRTRTFPRKPSFRMELDPGTVPPEPYTAL